MARFFRATLMLAFAALACTFAVCPAYALQMEVVDADGHALENASATTQPAKEVDSTDADSSLKPNTYNLKPAEGTVPEKAAEAEAEKPQQEAAAVETAKPNESTISETDVTQDAVSSETSENLQPKTYNLKPEVSAEVDKTAAVAANTSASNAISMNMATPKNGWVTENGKTRYYNQSKIQTGWLVTDSYKNYGLQRYWMGAYGDLVTSKIVNTDYNGYLTYCTNSSYVARYKYKEGDGKLYLATNEGRLENTGWLVTTYYDGNWYRYYIDETTHSARLGFFTVSGNKYYGFSDRGYVMHNDYDYLEGHWYVADNGGVLTNADGRFSRIEAYVSWMLGIAADDSHGYDQIYRWGERGDYDCSSLVISAVRTAGIDTRWASYTGNMRSAFTSSGFYCRGFDNLKRGDILLNDDYHVAIYIGNGQIVHASGNEWGGATGGQPGDQTAREICVRSYYDRPWYTVLRYNC